MKVAFGILAAVMVVFNVAFLDAIWQLLTEPATGEGLATVALMAALLLLVNTSLPVVLYRIVWELRNERHFHLEGLDETPCGLPVVDDLTPWRSYRPTVVTCQECQRTAQMSVAACGCIVGQAAAKGGVWRKGIWCDEHPDGDGSPLTGPVMV